MIYNASPNSLPIKSLIMKKDLTKDEIEVNI